MSFIHSEDFCVLSSPQSLIFQLSESSGKSISNLARLFSQNSATPTFSWAMESSYGGVDHLKPKPHGSMFPKNQYLKSSAILGMIPVAPSIIDNDYAQYISLYLHFWWWTTFFLGLNPTFDG